MRPLIFLLAALASMAPACAETGLASWYGNREDGRLMADGHRFNADGINAASLHYPFGTRLVVTNLANGRQAEVVIEDRGPYIRPRILDVSRGTARILGFEQQGVTTVRIEPVVDWHVSIAMPAASYGCHLKPVPHVKHRYVCR